jgi:hypothetical protein
MQATAIEETIILTSLSIRNASYEKGQGTHRTCGQPPTVAAVSVLAHNVTLEA